MSRSRSGAGATSGPARPTRPRKPRHNPALPAPSSADLGACCAWDGDTLVLNILGQPNAGRDAIGRVQGHQLQVSVTAAPVRGRATDHMVRFLAEQFGVAPSAVSVVFGRFNVNKQMRIRAPQHLPGPLRRVLDADPDPI